MVFTGFHSLEHTSLDFCKYDRSLPLRLKLVDKQIDPFLRKTGVCFVCLSSALGVCPECSSIVTVPWDPETQAPWPPEPGDVRVAPRWQSQKTGPPDIKTGAPDVCKIFFLGDTAQQGKNTKVVPTGWSKKIRNTNMASSEKRKRREKKK